MPVTGPPQPIEDYALIGDLQTAALVGFDGAIDWLCLPRFDSPACFARLLGDESAGSWLIAPRGARRAARRAYQEDTLVLDTTWETPEGSVCVTDFMPPRGQAADVVRIVTGLRGRVTMELTLRLRFDYGHIAPWLRADPSGREVTAIAGPDAVWLRSSVPVEVDGPPDGDVTSRFSIAPGDTAAFVLTYQPSHLPRPRMADPAPALSDTLRFWRGWLRKCSYTGEWSGAVYQALLHLKALTYAPTGGILAAATTSLPEELGGVRNWDYRYCWLRDATFTLQALAGCGYLQEAKAWREWLVRAVAGDPAQLQIMYAVDGARRLPELTLDWLPGYGGSAPVRIGNAAADQYQLDVWGEVLDGLHLTRDTGLEPNETAWEVQRALLDWLEGHWREPDNGLWEMRGPRRHFVHSKALAWAGLDRAVHSAEAHGLPGPVDAWRRLREEIHRDVCERGFDVRRNTFTQFYGSRGLDAALLQLPRVGFLPWTDERIIGTVDAVQRELLRDGFLLRYDPDADGGPDGLPGGEGVFVACSFWLADTLHAIGRVDEARRLFERLLDLRNDVGMLSEEYDPVHGHQLGNTPQAFSLVGLVNTARHLTGSDPRTRGPD